MLRRLFQQPQTNPFDETAIRDEFPKVLDNVSLELEKQREQFRIAI